MSDGTTVSFFVALVAGLFSFLSPCVLPLIPSYITFLTGLSLEDAAQARRAALLHAVLFVSGFTMIFMALGAGATALGSLLLQYRDWIMRAGGVLVIVFGLFLMGAFNLAFLSRERRWHLADKPVGYLGSVFVGIAFGAGWTPCLGPILGAILLLTSANSADANLGYGMLLLFGYSLGLAIPFLLAAVLLQHFIGFFTRVKKVMIWTSRVSGAVLVVLGLLMVTNYFSLLATYMASLTPEFILRRL